jgi:chromate transporter
MSSREFAELFAVAQAAPGPNLIVSTVLGWRIAGLWGALVATLCMSLPPAAIVYTVSRVWDRFSDRPWRQVLQDGIAPMVIGLIGSSGYLLAKGAASDWKGAVLSAAAAILTWKTRLNPLWILAGAAGLALAGVV